jgi:prophage tail gpP-like protein
MDKYLNTVLTNKRVSWYEARRRENRKQSTNEYRMRMSHTSGEASIKQGKGISSRVKPVLTDNTCKTQDPNVIIGNANNNPSDSERKKKRPEKEHEHVAPALKNHP